VTLEISRRRPSTARAVAAALAFLVCVATSGCRLFQSAVEAPGKVFSGKKKSMRPPQDVQQDVMRFADRFESQIVQAAHDATTRAGTPDARMKSLAWSIPARMSALTIATGPNPYMNLVDMLVLARLGRMVHEEHHPSTGAEEESGVTAVEAFKNLEKDIWTVAQRTLDQKQLDAIAAIVDTWHKENPDQTVTSFVRLPNFERLLAMNQEQGKNLFEQLGDLLSLDPLSGLEPAKREVAEARLLGERTLFYAQRAPQLISAQAELLGLRFASMPQVADALEKGDRVSEAAASLAKTAAGLPDALRTERKNAVEQISDELSKQREGLVRDLQSVEAPAERMLGEFRTTAESTKEMSAAVQGAVNSLDAFVARVQEPSKSPDEPETPSRPFDVREYGDAAAKIGGAAAQIGGALEGLDKSRRELAPLLDQASSKLDHSVARASALALGVGLALIAAAAGAAILVRRIPRAASKEAPATKSARA
jgi:hypothetical protein